MADWGVAKWGLLLPSLIVFVPTPAHAQFSYRTNGGALTITGYSGAGGVVAIPTAIDGLPVSMIGDYAFDYDTNLLSVTIPGSVSQIGTNAFAFCTSMTNVALETGISRIGDGAFGGCRSLSQVRIPSTVTSVGAYAFSSCTNLSAIEVDLLNPSYRSVDGVLFDKGQAVLIQYPNFRGGTYFVPESVTKIGDGAFYFSRRLTGLRLPNGVTNIADYAFSYCTSLQRVTMPDRVTRIADYAFSYCTSLTNVAIPSSVLAIGNYGFAGCTSLAAVTIATNVTTIGSYAFYGCVSLTRVTIPSSVTNLGSGAFNSCTALKGIYFQGNAPEYRNNAPLGGADDAVVYYLAGASGWGATYGGRVSVLWDAQIEARGPMFGGVGEPPGFNIVGSSDLVVVVEVCTDLGAPAWLSVATNTLAGGKFYFADPHPGGSISRFYRLRSP